MEKNYITLLCSKVKKEYEDFIENLKKCSPEQIIKRANEKVVKENIALEFNDESNIDLETEEAEALYEQDNTLDYIYSQWNDYDTDLYSNLIFESAELAVEESD